MGRSVPIFDDRENLSDGFEFSTAVKQGPGADRHAEFDGFNGLDPEAQKNAADFLENYNKTEKSPAELALAEAQDKENADAFADLEAELQGR